MAARILLLLVLSLGLAPAASTAGEVAGSVSLGVEGVHLASQGPIAVYLESRSGAQPGSPPGRRPAIRQNGAHFVPDFLVVAAGTTVDMPNDDTIFHNVFSLSRPNEFDLGVYPAGQSRSVTFAHAGLVRVYCSIHESMRGTVLVAPSRWFAVVSAGGAYRIRDVPPGSYSLHVWNERLPALERKIAVPDGSVRVDVTLGVPGS
jgi:hypothetical protein